MIVGKLLDSNTIKPSSRQANVDIGSWDYRAMWSFLRLQFGRGIDETIKAYMAKLEDQRGHRMSREEREPEMWKFFVKQVNLIGDARKIQFIFYSDHVLAVASLQHLLIPPEDVYDMAGRIIQEHYPQFKDFNVQGLAGATYEVQELPMFKSGIQIYGGCITTRQAITVSSWLSVNSCFNPLSWLGIGGFRSFFAGTTDEYERLLRIKVKEDLEPRLRQDIEIALDKNKSVKGRIAEVQKRHVKKSEAEIIMAALGLSYQLGVGTVDQVLQRLEHEAKTQWGMSMASSYVAAHGKFKAAPDAKPMFNDYGNVRQKLSTISAATLLIDDIRDTKDKSVDWLKAHVKSGEIPSLDDLIKRLKVKVGQQARVAVSSSSTNIRRRAFTQGSACVCGSSWSGSVGSDYMSISDS